MPGFTGYEGPHIGSEFKWRNTAMQTEATTATAPAEKCEPKITLEPIKGDSPNKLIHVNGRPRGRTSAKSMSRYGVMYSFLQLATGGSRRTVSISTPNTFNPGGVRLVNARVRSHSKKAHRNDGDERSTEQRIVDKVRELIRDGHLVHPDVEQRRIDARHERHASAEAAQAAQKKETFRTKAIEALREAIALGGADERAADPIVDAMEWAQSQ